MNGKNAINLAIFETFQDWALEVVAKLKSKQGMAIRREKRATKLVSIVMC